MGLALFFLPATASASCGKHVHFDGERACEPGKPCPPVVPCKGPRCSQAPDSAPLTAPATPVRPFDPDPAVLPAKAAADAAAARLRPDAACGRAVHHVFPPEPPPRSSH